MLFSLSTHWNSARHASGYELIDEALSMGFNAVELGYNTSLDQVEGIRTRVAEGAVVVSSLHNFCPIPMGAPFGHPELFLLADPDRDARARAVRHTGETIRFAVDLGTRIVVTHCGYVKTRIRTAHLLDMLNEGRGFTPRYEKKLHKLRLQREKRATRALDILRSSLEQLIPVLRDTGVRLALENLPSWETCPNESEVLMLCRDYAPHIAVWHDIGHGQIRRLAGFVNPLRWLEQHRDHLAGFHVHDVSPPSRDHVMPPRGSIDFAGYREFARMPIPLVLEPAPDTPPDQIREGLAFLKNCWSEPNSPTP